jgi:hypothetical protein
MEGLPLHLLGHIGRDPRALAAVELGPLDPLVQGLRRTADLREIDMTASRRDPCQSWLPWTIRTARSRTSGENLVVVAAMMGPSYSRVAASGKLGAVHYGSRGLGGVLGLLVVVLTVLWDLGVLA